VARLRRIGERVYAADEVEAQQAQLEELLAELDDLARDSCPAGVACEWAADKIRAILDPQ
jgi:hypothetical protein